MFSLSLKMNACMKWKDAELFIFPTLACCCLQKVCRKLRESERVNVLAAVSESIIII